MTRFQFQKHLIPILLLLVGVAGAFWLARQDRAMKVPTTQVERPTPRLWTQEQDREPTEPPMPPGAVIRNLDRLNAAAAAVGCPTMEIGDPAVKILDVAECLGEKAVSHPGSRRNLPAGQPGTGK